MCHVCQSIKSLYIAHTGARLPNSLQGSKAPRRWRRRWSRWAFFFVNHFVVNICLSTYVVNMVFGASGPFSLTIICSQNGHCNGVGGAASPGRGVCCGPVARSSGWLPLWLFEQFQLKWQETEKNSFRGKRRSISWTG